MLDWGRTNYTIHCLNLHTGNSVRGFAAHENGVRAIAFSPDGKLLASAEGNEIRVWDAVTGRQLRVIPGQVDFTIGLSFVSDARTIVSVSANHAIQTWDVATGREIRRTATEINHRLAFSPDGRILATWEPNNRFGALVRIEEAKLRLWDAVAGKELRSWMAPAASGLISALAFSPDGKVLASGSHDTTVLLWDVAAASRATRRRPADLSPSQAQSLWDDLAGSDAAKAYRAIWALADAPGQSMRFLEERL